MQTTDQERETASEGTLAAGGGAKAPSSLQPHCTTPQEAAQAYAGRGWAVFPCGGDDGKRPLCKWRDASTTDPATIPAGSNVAVDCGKSGLVVLDLDNKDGRDGLTDWETLRASLAIDDAQALVTETPSGGRHLIFADPTGGLIGNSKRALPDGIDVRGNGGYIVAPPSKTAEGVYRWIRNGAQPGPLPPEIVKLLLDKPEPQRIHTPPRHPSGRGRAYAEAALEAEAELLASTAPGGRNDQLNRSAFALGQLVGAGALSRSEVEAALYNACISNGEVHDKGERSVRASLKSGLDAGEREPRVIPEPDARPERPAENESPQNTDAAGDAEAQGHPERVNTWPYAIEGGRIVYQKRKSDEEIVSVPVADFTAQITHEITSEYGDRHYRLVGKAVAGGEFTAEIKAEDFAETRQLVATLDAAAGALDPVRSGMRRHLGPAIKLLSRGSNIEHWRRFERVGWEGKRYLIPGRLDDRTECRTDRGLPFACPADADLAQGTQALEHLLGALDPTITAPVIGYMLLPPIARAAGLHNERFGLFIVGRTGVLKTSYMQAALSCWGAGFLDDNTLLKWGEGSTRNAIMALATQATDAPLLIDNYKPGTGGGAENFIALWHNIIEGGEKRRLSRAAELKETRPVWAWPIATGEAVPSEDAATLARMLVVEFDWTRGQNNERLARAQLLAPHLPAILGAVLDWLEGEGREWAQHMGATFTEKRQEYALRMLEVEAEAINARRMGSSLAMLDIGWSILSAHPTLGEIFTPYTAAFVDGLEKITVWQAQHSLEALEARQFLDGLRKLLDSGRLWLADNRDMGTEAAQERRPGFVGWRDGEGGAYVLPDAITQIKRMTGTRLNGVSDGTIYAQLAEIDALAGSHGNRNTYRVRVGPARKENPRTLWLTAQALGEGG